MTDPTQVTEQLDRIAAVVGDVLTRAEDKPEAVKLMATVLSDLHSVLKNIAVLAEPKVEAPVEPTPRRSGLRGAAARRSFGRRS